MTLRNGFATDTEARCALNSNILFSLDGYVAEKSSNALQLLTNYNIIVIALPAYTNHRTQIIDYNSQ